MGRLIELHKKISSLIAQMDDVPFEELTLDPTIHNLHTEMAELVENLLAKYPNVIQNFRDEVLPALNNKYVMDILDGATISRIKSGVLSSLHASLARGLIYTQEDMEDLFYIIVSNITINGKNIDV